MRLLIIAWTVSLLLVGGTVAWLEYGAPGTPSPPGSVEETEEPDTGPGQETAEAEAEPPAPGAAPPENTVPGAPSGGRETTPQVTPANRPTPGGDPLDRLYEDGPEGPLPVTQGGLTPMQAFAATPAPGDDPAIAIILTGLGLSGERTQSAIRDLPYTVTLAFSPYGSELAARTQAARAGGHELLLMVPMEPQDYPANDPGPDTLQAGINPQANINRLHSVMSRFRGYVGLINHMGSRFTAQPGDMAPVMEDLQRRGLLFVDSRASGASVLPDVAETHGIPVLENDRYLDNQPRADTIRENLENLELLARQRGYAVGVARALPVTIATLAEWADGLSGRGYRLVPVTQAVALKDGE